MKNEFIFRNHNNEKKNDKQTGVQPDDPWWSKAKAFLSLSFSFSLSLHCTFIERNVKKLNPKPNFELNKPTNMNFPTRLCLGGIKLKSLKLETHGPWRLCLVFLTVNSGSMRNCIFASHISTLNIKKLLFKNLS
jgi:hypothetical protein